MGKRILKIALFIPFAIAQTFVQVPFCLIKWIIDGKEWPEPWVVSLIEW